MRRMIGPLGPRQKKSSSPDVFSFSQRKRWETHQSRQSHPGQAMSARFPLLVRILVVPITTALLSVGTVVGLEAVRANQLETWASLLAQGAVLVVAVSLLMIARSKSILPLGEELCRATMKWLGKHKERFGASVQLAWFLCTLILAILLAFFLQEEIFNLLGFEFQSDLDRTTAGNLAAIYLMIGSIESPLAKYKKK